MEGTSPNRQMPRVVEGSQERPPFRPHEGLDRKSHLDFNITTETTAISEESTACTTEFLRQELSVDRLNSIHKHLWWAGRPGNVRPLHRQLMLSRQILISEDPSLHLVWYNSTIFIKPLPSFLLDWKTFSKETCPSPEIYGLAAGFLFTYSRLIRHPSDLKIAQNFGLLPEHISWSLWSGMAEVLCQISPLEVDQRYQYGELRLSRLNQICRFCCLKRQYFSPYTEYSAFFTSNFAWFFVMFACLSVVLGAFQVVLATSPVTNDFTTMAHGFSLFTIALTFGAVMFVTGLFTFLFLYFLQSTLRFHHVAQEIGTI